MKGERKRKGRREGEREGMRERGREGRREKTVVTHGPLRDRRLVISTTLS